MRKIRMAAVSAAFVSVGLVQAPARAVNGCTTLTSTTLLTCTFTADAETGSYHADSTWSLVDASDGGRLVGIGEPSTEASPLTPLPPFVQLVVGHDYTFTLSTAGVGVIASGI